MKRFGLIGKKLSHSFSADYFNTKFSTLGIDNTYQLFEIENLNQIHKLIKDNDLKGLNITIPYKTDIIQFLDSADKMVELTGACNTIKVKNGRLIGYNTDIIGFEKLMDSFLQTKIKEAIILGNGGAAQSVKYILQEKNISFKIFSRNEGKDCQTYAAITNQIIAQSDLIINTTPVGMSPNSNTYPILPYNAINQQHNIIDLIYNPNETLFMQKCRSRGAKVTNGLTMLYEQAEAAWEIWNKP